MTTCDLVAERVALAEPLAELEAHAATCPACARLVQLPGQLGSVHREVDPGLGFAARMSVGARHRLAVRRRRRIAGVVSAAVVAASAVALLATRVRDDDVPHNEVATSSNRQPDPVADQETLGTLVRFADTGRSRRLSAPWHEIQRPLRPYRKLLRGVKP